MATATSAAIAGPAPGPRSAFADQGGLPRGYQGWRPQRGFEGQRLLGRRLKAAVVNFGELLVASRNLNFFTSFYR